MGNIDAHQKEFDECIDHLHHELNQLSDDSLEQEERTILLERINSDLEYLKQLFDKINTRFDEYSPELKREKADLMRRNFDLVITIENELKKYCRDHERSMFYDQYKNESWNTMKNPYLNESIDNSHEEIKEYNRLSRTEESKKPKYPHYFRETQIISKNIKIPFPKRLDDSSCRPDTPDTPDRPLRPERPFRCETQERPFCLETPLRPFRSIRIENTFKPETSERSICLESPIRPNYPKTEMKLNRTI